MTDATKAVSFTKDDLAQKYGQRGKSLSGNTVRQTMSACGLSTSKREYTADEEEKFKLARKMIEEDNKTYREVAEHFKVNLKDIGSGNGDAFFENQATEASDSGDVSFELANAIAVNQAAQVASMVPALTMYHLNQMMSGGAVHTKLQQLVVRIQGMGGNTHEMMMQGIQRLEEHKVLASANGSSNSKVSGSSAKQLASADSKTASTASKSSTQSTTKSSSTSTASSEPKSTDTAKK